MAAKRVQRRVPEITAEQWTGSGSALVRAFTDDDWEIGARPDQSYSGVDGCGACGKPWQEHGVMVPEYPMMPRLVCVGDWIVSQGDAQIADVAMSPEAFERVFEDAE